MHSEQTLLSEVGVRYLNTSFFHRSVFHEQEGPCRTRCAWTRDADYVAREDPRELRQMVAFGLFGLFF